jgi:hypothetical protein
MSKKTINLIIIFCIFLSSCKPMKEKADLLVVDGHIYSVDSADRKFESMAIKDGKILKLGTTDYILAKYSGKDTIYANGKSIFPGFIDAHCHFVGLAKNLQYVDLTGSGSFEEVIERVKSFQSVLPGSWIVGRGWDQNLWKNKQFPDKQVLDKLFPDQPVALIRIDGHVVLANESALKTTRIKKDNRFGTEEVRVKNGKLTGILCENAADYIRSVIPVPDDGCMAELLTRAEKMCYSYGLTGVSDAGLDYNTICFIDVLQRQKKLKISIYAMVESSSENILFFVKMGPYERGSLTIRSIKYMQTEAWEAVPRF